VNTEQRIIQSLMFELDEAKSKIAALEEENWRSSERAFGQGHAAGFDKSWAIAKGTPFVNEVLNVIQGSQTTEGTRSEPPVTEIRASAISDEMPVNECEHLFCVVGERMYFFTYCPKCGEKL